MKLCTVLPTLFSTDMLANSSPCIGTVMVLYFCFSQRGQASDSPLLTLLHGSDSDNAVSSPVAQSHP